MLIVVAVIFLTCMIIGCVRGFVRIAATLAATMASILLVALLSPILSGMILEIVPMEKMVQSKCEEMMGVKNEEGEIVIPDEVESSKEKQIKIIEKAKLPNVFKQVLLENNNEEIYKVLGVDSFSEYVGKYLAKLVADILSFLLALLAVTVILRTILYMFGIIEKLPVIGGLNRMGGFLLGAGTGLIIVWILFIIITLAYDTGIGRKCLESILDSKILSFLYNKNILLNYITKFRG